MVSGKIFGFSASIIILVIAIAVVIRFGSGLKIGDRLNEGLQGLSDSFNSFFDSLLPQGIAQSQSTPKSIPNPAPPKFIPSPDGKGSVQAPPPLTINPNSSIPISVGGGGAGGFKQDETAFEKPPDDFFTPFLDTFGNLFTLPVAFAEEPPKLNSQPQNKIPKSNSVSSGQKSINVKGEVKGVKINEGFSADDSVVGAIIRPTPIDRSKILVDERKNPIETASQRANRVFEETGEFVDVKRGSKPFSKSKNSDFDFGTNTGSGQRGSTEQDTQTNRESLLQREAEKARRIFDAGSISNF